MSLNSIINTTDYHYSNLHTEENQIIGNLFRELLTFERRPYTQKTVDQINQVINMAHQQCKDIGSNGILFNTFVARLNIR